MKWNGIVEKMKNGNGMGWEKWVIQTYGQNYYVHELKHKPMNHNIPNPISLQNSYK